MGLRRQPEFGGPLPLPERRPGRRAGPPRSSCRSSRPGARAATRPATSCSPWTAGACSSRWAPAPTSPKGMPARRPSGSAAWEAGARPRRRLGPRGGPRRRAGHRSRGAGAAARFATGIRNCRRAWPCSPATGEVWCSTNERDGLGDDLVPDYITRVREGGFYGWPWYYMGNHEDPRHAGERPDLAGKDDRSPTCCCRPTRRRSR